MRIHCSLYILPVPNSVAMVHNLELMQSPFMKYIVKPNYTWQPPSVSNTTGNKDTYRPCPKTENIIWNSLSSHIDIDASQDTRLDVIEGKQKSICTSVRFYHKCTPCETAFEVSAWDSSTWLWVGLNMCPAYKRYCHVSSPPLFW
jgi:hypothetical protein